MPVERAGVHAEAAVAGLELERAAHDTDHYLPPVVAHADCQLVRAARAIDGSQPA